MALLVEEEEFCTEQVRIQASRQRQECVLQMIWSVQVQESPPLDGNRSARDAASQAAGRRQFRAPQIPPASASIVYVTDLPVVRRWIRTLQHPMLPCIPASP
ncbi:hypothetical protein [Oryza sativa Japonica Group]|uniref:Uncharacterized protein P0443D08.43 n=1 Tax=Oryza sativa subsp. japonica TaxID=39947 RepID=Q5ZC53_ORYSJ|nr:hypothetical protein [Oryza sativa Japonica Group]